MIGRMAARFNVDGTMPALASRSDFRPAAVAGLFYPGSAADLDATIGSLLAGPPSTERVPKALIVPHAGYLYSGAVAARAYRTLVPGAASLRRVVLLGPSHRDWFRGLAIPCVHAFATPLGLSRVDRDSIDQLAALPAVVVTDAPHAREHSLEVQLPFLQRLLPQAAIVPVLVGEASAASVESVIEATWGGPETVVVVSSDLSHYQSYDEACTLDAATAAAIVQGRADLTGTEACGCVAVNGLVRVARRRHMTIELLDLCNSGDTTGDRARVVGYGAFGFYDA